MRLGLYKDPEDVKSDSKAGDIAKNMRIFLKSQGKTEEALSAIEKAQKMYPKDLDLILSQADIYFELGQTDRFGELMQQAVEQDPTNPKLFFNLGVISSDQGKTEEATKYYLKAIELQSDYGDAYMNLAVLILDEEKAIIDEMNKNLSDFDKYEELQEKQKGVYKKALPYLENADKYGEVLILSKH